MDDRIPHAAGEAVARPADRSERHESVSDRVVAEVLKLIAGGEFAPGDRLPSERRLAEMFDVSRVSVRAGLQNLKAQGFLITVPGGGTKVSDAHAHGDPALATLTKYDRTSLADLLEIRTLLEVWAARRAAHRADPVEILQIEREIERMAGADGDKAQADVDFHLAIARASGSLVYRHILGVIRGTLMEMLRYQRFALFTEPAHEIATLEQHRAIAAAISARDPDAAEEAMRRHLAWVRRHYIRGGIA